MHDGRRAHRARFQGHVQRGVEQPVAAQRPAPGAQRFDFRVGGRIMGRNRAVAAVGNHAVPQHQHRPHGHFGARLRLRGQRQRLAHEIDVGTGHAGTLMKT